MSQLASKIPVGLAMFLPKIVQHVTAGQQDTSWISNVLPLQVGSDVTCTLK
ncbi:hypothetical protein DPMN_118403 [Dreissena polymorpha]|uniref:Uncharacterized protein n=1 Tax=Dreissena polymorpha TaxID=45954 RepID=A0A9D4GHC9_DREPO|nr:hypothetical protein DPMN_118403 [Dreissena polymorpha]